MNFFERWMMRRKLPSSDCARIAEIIQQYLDSEGTPELAARVERHLQDCEMCRIEAAALVDLKDAIRRHGERDLDARSRLEEYAERLARGEINTADDTSGN